MNVIDILNDRRIKFKEAGKDYQVKCLNPEHEDNNPSMRIDKITGIFHCFSCGFKGNLFEHYGAEPNFIDIRVSKLQNKIRELLSNQSLIMPVDAVHFTQNYRNISKETYIEANAFTTNIIEELKDRICFPLYDIRGNIKVFLGRSAHSDYETKYLFYPRNVSPPLFPPHPEIWKNTLIIVEGIFDALNLMDKGCYNIISAFGTHTLLKTYREKLAHYKILGVNKFYIMFDGDEAGYSAADKLERVLNENDYNAEIIKLPEGIDPGDLTEQDVSNLMIGIYGGNENSSN